MASVRWTSKQNTTLESNDEKPIPDYEMLSRWRCRWPYCLGVYGRLPALAGRLGHAESLVLKVRWHL
jgi:hypothetical protein